MLRQPAWLGVASVPAGPRGFAEFEGFCTGRFRLGTQIILSPLCLPISSPRQADGILPSDGRRANPDRRQRLASARSSGIAGPVFIVRINPRGIFAPYFAGRKPKNILPGCIHSNRGSRIQTHENSPSLNGGINGSAHRFQEASMKNVSIGAWRERTRLGLGLAILAAGAGLQLLQWLHTSVPG